MNPDLKNNLNKQSFLPSLSFLPSAYAAAPIFTYVYGNLLVDDINGAEVPATYARVCAFDHELVNGNFVNTKVKLGQTHVCDETDSTGFFKLVTPTADPVGAGNVDLFLIAYSTGTKVEVTDASSVVHSVVVSLGNPRTITAGIFNYRNLKLSSANLDTKAFWPIHEITPITSWYKNTINHDMGRINVQ